jgi:hypothetical protein
MHSEYENVTVSKQRKMIKEKGIMLFMLGVCCYEELMMYEGNFVIFL